MPTERPLGARRGVGVRTVRAGSRCLPSVSESTPEDVRTVLERSDGSSKLREASSGCPLPFGANSSINEFIGVCPAIFCVTHFVPTTPPMGRGEVELALGCSIRFER